MPLPESGTTPWPPPHCATPLADMDAWHAWYSGDTDYLAGVYGDAAGLAGNPQARSFFDLDRLARGTGILGKAVRMFWGQPTTPGQQPAKLHIPLAGDIAELSANLLFSDVPTVTAASALGSDATATTDRLRAYLDDTGHATLREGAEIDSGLGGVYLRVVWDPDLSDRPWIDVVYPDAAVPEWRWGRLSAVTFWQELDPLYKDSERWRLLQRYEKGSIQYGLYCGTVDELGVAHPLVDHPDAAEHATVIDGDDGVTQTLLVDRMLAVYVPNIRPNRLWRGVPGAQALGRSDYSGVEPMMDALDEVWSSWMRDIRLGKSRIMLPQSMLESNGPGQGAVADLDREVFVGLTMLDDGSGGAITESQFAIRVDEHERSAKALRAQILSSAGYSAQSFGDEGGVAVTATEVAARKEQSLTTRGQKILYWRTALQDILAAQLAVDAAYFKAPGVDPGAELTVSWPQAVQPDPEATARTLTLLESAGAVSLYMKVRMLHPEWEEQQVREEMERIRGDKPGVPVELRGGPGVGDAPDAEADAEEPGGSATGEEPASEDGVGGGESAG